MAEVESRAALEARKLELFTAIRQLERDRDDGLIDERAYAGARLRYEVEAAGVLERLDGLAEFDEPAASARPAARNRTFVMAGAAGLVIVALAIFLLASLHARTGTAAITGDVGQASPAPVATVSPRLVAAQRAAAAHPGDANAQLRLGAAYLDVGDNRAADRAYQRAATLDARRPEGPTMHAMLLGTGGQAAAGLAAIGAVERAHPGYAKAWFVDGLLASRTKGGLPRAIRAWRTFLTLAPHSAVASEVRMLLSSAEKARRPGG